MFKGVQKMNDPATWMATYLPQCKHIDAYGFESARVPESVQEWVRQNWVVYESVNPQDVDVNLQDQWTVYHKLVMN